MVVRRDEHIARLARNSHHLGGRLQLATEAPQLVEAIPLDAIDPDPAQPRRYFDPEQLRALADSLKSAGQLQPIIVVRAGERYRIHIGERRWRACRLAGLPTVRALVRVTQPEAIAARIAQIVENEQRAPLTTSELIEAVRDLQANGLKNVEIAAALSKGPARVSELTALADAPSALRAIIDQIGLDLSYQLLRQYRATPDATLQYLAHVPVHHINRVTITGIDADRQDTSDASDKRHLLPHELAPATGTPMAMGVEAREGASPPVSARGLRASSPALSTPPAAAATPASDPFGLTGSILVVHTQHGPGHVVFGAEADTDHLAISFAGAAAIVLHKDDVTIVLTSRSDVALA